MTTAIAPAGVRSTRKSRLYNEVNWLPIPFWLFLLFSCVISAWLARWYFFQVDDACEEKSDDKCDTSSYYLTFLPLGFLLLACMLVVRYRVIVTDQDLSFGFMTPLTRSRVAFEDIQDICSEEIYWADWYGICLRFRFNSCGYIPHCSKGSGITIRMASKHCCIQAYSFYCNNPKEVIRLVNEHTPHLQT